MMDRDEGIALLRAFNRTYTRRLGLLDAYLDQSDFTLSEARIMYEIVNRKDATAAEIGRALDLDRAQISRTLKRLAERGVVSTREDPSHGRHQLLSLTADGMAAFNTLEAATNGAVGALLEGLPPIRRQQLLSAARVIRTVFETEAVPSITLRALKTGDMGMIVHRQALLYATEQGYDERYEGLIAGILSDYQETFDPTRDAGWVAEADGRIVGSVFLIHTDRPTVGKLRLLYVEPDARGLGVGKRLVNGCIERACEVGYDQLELWTDNVLSAARSIYERAGFKLMAEAPARLFGTETMSQTWSLDLRSVQTKRFGSGFDPLGIVSGMPATS